MIHYSDDPVKNLRYNLSDLLALYAKHEELEKLVDGCMELFEETKEKIDEDVIEANREQAREEGYQEGREEGYQEGRTDAYDDGHYDGYRAALDKHGIKK